jgi:hypothetical protein
MQSFYNLTPAEQYKYTGSISEVEVEDLLAHSNALEEIRDVFWDVDQAIEGRKPKRVLELLDQIRKLLDDAGV